MQLSEIHFDRARPIDGYGPGFFRVGGEVIRGAALVLPGGVSRWGGVRDLAPLTAAAAGIDVLLVGTGATIAQLPPALREAMERLGVGVEFMASPAACRTYNVLLAEGRRVAAALLPV